MSAEGPKSYPVVYDADAGALQYSFQTGYVAVPVSMDQGITQLTGEVTAGPGSGSQVATVGTIAHTLVVNPATNQLVLGGVSGGKTTTISATAPTANQVLTIPDLGNPVNSFIMGFGDQTINGNLTTASVKGTLYLLVGTGSSLTEIATNVSTGPRTVNIPEVGATSNFVLSEGAQTLNGTYTYTKAQVLHTSALATSGTVTPVGTAGPTFTIAVSGDITLNGPSSPVDGQKVTFRILNDASHTVTLAAGSGNFRFGTDITSYTNSVSLTDYVGAIYNSSATRWDVVSVIQGF